MHRVSSAWKDDLEIVYEQAYVHVVLDGHGWVCNCQLQLQLHVKAGHHDSDHYGYHDHNILRMTRGHVTIGHARHGPDMMEVEAY